VAGLSKAFAGVHAVSDVELQLREGEVLGIIGPNGAGKTTLFDLISGYLEPDRGSILLDGVDIAALPPHRRAVAGLGRSFQDARLFGSLTVAQAIAVCLDRELELRDPVAEAIAHPAVLRAERALTDRVDELIEVMGLQAFRDKFVGELSTGSRRIVDLACQFGLHPRVILFDEPSSGIAQREAEALGPLILRMRDELGASVLLIEHDMPLVTSVSDRLLALHLGTNLIDGPAETVLHDPDVIASYLGATRGVIERSETRSNGSRTRPLVARRTGADAH
jgi:branched-chain amino acid transport system ATP-binding protein